ncbi:MAG: alpha/beta fold hydrolase [Proteobacteria bacterium]|nr:alpha/beta fold hydrolase [Pseudomonadota bacterium]
MAEIIINGPEGRIEARYHQADQKNAPAALVLHPHPKHGGTMNNKVVYNLYHSFVKNGFSVLRFNFRGVGRSQGQFDNGVGELTDAAAALDWLQQHNQDASTFWISGFSFGSWIAMQLLMRRPELDSFIAVAPPANMYDFSFLSPCPSSGIIVQGDQDSIVPEESTANLAKKLSAQKNIKVDYSVIRGGDHFFRTSMEEMNKVCDAYIAENIANFARRPRLKPDRRRRQLPNG